MKNMLSFLFLCFSFLVCSNFNLWAKSSISVVHNYECDEENSENHDVEFSLKNQSFSANVFLQAFPNPKIQNWGIKQSEKDFSFLAGNISFSGIKSRLNNPLWQSVNTLRVFSTPKLFNSAQLPSSISTSENYSIFAKYNPIFENKLFGFINGIEVSSLWTPKEDGGIFLGSLILPIQIANSKLNLSSSFASSFVDFSDSAWYTKSKYFESQRLNRFLQEINFLSRCISFYSGFCFSSDPFENFKFYTRNDLTFNFEIGKNAKYETEARFFYSQNDFITLSEKTLKQPLAFTILPKVTFKTGTSNLIFALGYDYSLGYSDGKEKEKIIDDQYQFAFKFEFLYWNFTSKTSFEPQEMNFEFYNSAFFYFLTSEKITMSNSTWVKILTSKINEEFEISCSTKFNASFFTKQGFIKSEVSSKLISDLKNDSLDLSYKAKFSWRTLWISANFSDIKFEFSDETKKGDSNKGITFSVSSGFTLNY